MFSIETLSNNGQRIAVMLEMYKLVLLFVFILTVGCLIIDIMIRRYRLVRCTVTVAVAVAATAAASAASATSTVTITVQW